MDMDKKAAYFFLHQEEIPLFPCNPNTLISLAPCTPGILLLYVFI